MGKSLLKVFVFFSLIIILAITLVEISVKDTEKFKVIRKQEFYCCESNEFLYRIYLKKENGYSFWLETDLVGAEKFNMNSYIKLTDNELKSYKKSIDK